MVVEYAPEETLKDTNKHMISIKYSVEHRDYSIHGFNEMDYYSIPLILKTDIQKIKLEFESIISVRIVCWKEIYATKLGSA